MTRQNLFIVIVLFTQIALQLSFRSIGYNKLAFLIGIICLSLLVLNGLSCLTDKGYKFWTKKIKFKK